MVDDVKRRDEVRDLLVTVTDGSPEELQGFRIFRVWDAVPLRDMVNFSLRACDVDVKRSSGFFVSQMLSGKPYFTGKDALDKERKVLFHKGFVLPLKFGRPGVFLVFPDRFVDLPQVLKDHPLFGSVFELAYSADERVRAELEVLRNSNMSQAEYESTVTSTVSKALEFFAESNKKMMDGVVREVAGKIPQMQPQGVTPQNLVQ